MRKIFTYKLTSTIVLLVLSMAFASEILAITPQQVAQRAAAAVSGTKGLSAVFSISGDGMSSKGTIKSAGQKFSVITPHVSIWFNGKSMFTYNPRTSETTVTAPDAQELLESNPLLYVKGGASGYTCSFSQKRVSGKYMVDLKPRNARSGIKKLTFTVNAGNYHVEKIVIETASGKTVVNVVSLKTGISPAMKEFEYPRSKFPKAEIIDLR